MTDNFRKSKLIQVIETRTLEGQGTEKDMYRIVIYYNDPKDGRLLAVYDVGKEKKC